MDQCIIAVDVSAHLTSQDHQYMARNPEFQYPQKKGGKEKKLCFSHFTARMNCFCELKQESAAVLSLRHTVDLFWEQNIKRCPDPTVTLHYFHWPTTRPDAHTKIALRLQSSSHSGDTNGMIDTNVSRANCAADLHRSDRASYPSTHLACWQELPWRFFFFFFFFPSRRS